MDESILTSIKKLLGINEDYTHFDQDLIIHINSVFTILNQLNVGPSVGFSITGGEQVWGDFLDDNDPLELVKSYVYLKVKLLFDPPLSSSVTDVIKGQIAEFEWRLNVAADTDET